MRRLISVCMAAAFLFIAANAGFAQTHTMGKEAVVDALTPIRPVKSAKAKPVRAQSEDGTQSAQGTLKEVLKEALGWEGASVVYIVSTDLLKAKGMTPDDVKAITFLPDPVLYDADAYEVFVDDITPKMARENRKKKKNAPKTLYVRLLTKANDVAPEVAPPAPDPTGKPEPPATPGALELRVKAEGYEAGRWARSAPKFTLSGIPEGGKRYFYAVIAYDEQFHERPPLCCRGT